MADLQTEPITNWHATQRHHSEDAWRSICGKAIGETQDRYEKRRALVKAALPAWDDIPWCAECVTTTSAQTATTEGEHAMSDTQGSERKVQPTAAEITMPTESLLDRMRADGRLWRLAVAEIEGALMRYREESR